MVECWYWFILKAFIWFQLWNHGTRLCGIFVYIILSFVYEWCLVFDCSWTFGKKPEFANLICQRILFAERPRLSYSVCLCCRSVRATTATIFLIVQRWMISAFVWSHHVQNLDEVSPRRVRHSQNEHKPPVINPLTENPVTTKACCVQ